MNIEIRETLSTFNLTNFIIAENEHKNSPNFGNIQFDEFYQRRNQT